MALLHRDVDRVRAPLNDCAFANAADSNGRTALHYAVVPDPPRVGRSYLLVNAEPAQPRLDTLRNSADATCLPPVGSTPKDASGDRFDAYCTSW